MNPGASGPEATYSPGDWVAIASVGTWLLAEIGPQSPAIPVWWDAISSGAAVTEVLGLLVQEGFRAVRSFALVGTDERSAVGTIALRGSARARLTSGERERDLAGEGAATWLQEDLDSTLDAVVLFAGSSDGSMVRLPLTAGVSLASGIYLDLASRGAVGDRRSAPDLPDQPTGQLETSAESVKTSAGSAVGSNLLEDDEPIVKPVDHQEQSDSQPAGFDHLFGATQRPLVQPVEAVAPPPDDDGLVAVQPVGPPPDQGSDSSRAGVETLHPIDTQFPRPSVDVDSDSTDLIDALPWSLGEPTSQVPTPAAPVSRPPSTPLAGAPIPTKTPEVRSDTTVNRAALLAAAGSETRMGPTVKAVQCPVGHLNPAQAGTCRICQAAVPLQGAVTAPRPVLGSIRLSTGDVVTLDRGVVMGRSPEPPGGNDPGRPHVLKVASPEQDISRTHLEVRLDGWHVLVVDLDSTNGTVVTLPGQRPQRLHPNAPLAIEPGSLVSLADEVTFVYEVGP